MDPARAAAQRAFFEAALGKAAAATAPAPTQVEARPPVQRTPDAAQARPEKLLRPGSLLDIRV
jgi:hypothetical protein